jgi:hypothetical protein
MDRTLIVFHVPSCCNPRPRVRDALSSGACTYLHLLEVHENVMHTDLIYILELTQQIDTAMTEID